MPFPKHPGFVPDDKPHDYAHANHWHLPIKGHDAAGPIVDYQALDATHRSAKLWYLQGVIEPQKRKKKPSQPAELTQKSKTWHEQPKPSTENTSKCKWLRLALKKISLRINNWLKS